jgi:nucleoside-diphosphate-sugar epimerase
MGDCFSTISPPLEFRCWELPAAPYDRRKRTLISRRPRDLVGDFSKLNRLTGWQPSVSFAEMVRRLLNGVQDQIRHK